MISDITCLVCKAITYFDEHDVFNIDDAIGCWQCSAYYVVTGIIKPLHKGTGDDLLVTVQGYRS